MMHKINKAGYTIVEILVVIAIIGLLSAIVLNRIEDAKKKARIAFVQQGMASAVPAIVMCLQDGKTLNVDGLMSPQYTLNHHICGNDGAKWFDIPTKGRWKLKGFGYSTSNVSFEMILAADDDRKRIICTEKGCITENYTPSGGIGLILI